MTLGLQVPKAPAKGDQRIVRKGLKIAPVDLDRKGKKRALVGRGSYLVNAVGGCPDCHSCPTYVTDPSTVDDADNLELKNILNTETYLAGGVPFGPFISANLTPDESGKPEGHTLEEFIDLMRTGKEDGEVLHVHPWPLFRNMVRQDLRAIYEYLRTIPSVPDPEPGGACSGPAEIGSAD